MPFGVEFEESYKLDIFQLWYSNGRPGSLRLYQMIPANIDGDRPTKSTLARWIDTEFREKAASLDQMVETELQNRLVQEKIEMLQRHANLGVKMQDTAIEYLDAHKEELNPNAAVRLLVEGVRIERESRGLPDALRKMSEMSDDDLVKQIEKIIADAPIVSIEPNE